jgi:hypothetical protein
MKIGAVAIEGARVLVAGTAFPHDDADSDPGRA